jgi:hypothetical protein
MSYQIGYRRLKPRLEGNFTKLAARPPTPSVLVSGQARRRRGKIQPHAQ